MCRSSVRSIFVMPPFDNPLIIWGVGIEIALLFVVNYSPSANVLLNTMPVSSEVWLLLAPCVLGFITLEELRKALMRRQLGRKASAEILCARLRAEAPPHNSPAAIRIDAS